LLDSILGLTPQKSTGGDDSGSATAATLRLIAELKDRVPDQIDVMALKHKLKGDDNPLNVVLIQEIVRYNVLLSLLVINLDQVEKGMKGLVVINPELESILTALEDNKVPIAWSFCYFS